MVRVVPGKAVLRTTTVYRGSRIAPPICRHTSSRWVKSIPPSGRLGVPTHTHAISVWRTAWVQSVVARSRPDRTASLSSSSTPGSTIGERPALTASTFERLTSTPMISWPRSARQAAETTPT